MWLGTEVNEGPGDYKGYSGASGKCSILHSLWAKGTPCSQEHLYTNHTKVAYHLNWLCKSYIIVIFNASTWSPSHPLALFLVDSFQTVTLASYLIHMAFTYLSTNYNYMCFGIDIKTKKLIYDYASESKKITLN